MLLMLLALNMLLPAAVQAGGLLDLLKKPYVGPAPNMARNPGRNAAVPPAHQRYYAANVEDYPWLKNGLAIPTYNWGYFGAHYQPSTVTQHPYTNDYSGFSYRTAD
jgi:hypothetical protein